jgi:hypothetical protein
MIEAKFISENEWRAARANQPSKWVHSHWIAKFNQVAEQHLHEFDGRLEYYKFNKLEANRAGRGVLEYTENTPIVNLFKVSPYGYYLNNYDVNDIWRYWDLDSNIINVYQNMQTNKYQQGDQKYDASNYILFPLQANRTFARHSFDLKILLKCILWATANQRTILFKLHPHTDPAGHVYRYWNDLKAMGVISKYTVLVLPEYNIDELIANADAVWSFSSGAIMQAAIAGKPVASFWPSHDWLPIAPFCDSPESAAAITELNTEDRDRFLSWYYQSLTIDVSAANFEQRLVQRFRKCLGNNETDLYKIFGPLGTHHS